MADPLREERRRAEIEQHEIGLEAGRDAADAMVQVERFGTAARREVEQLAGGKSRTAHARDLVGLGERRQHRQRGAAAHVAGEARAARACRASSRASSRTVRCRGTGSTSGSARARCRSRRARRARARRGGCRGRRSRACPAGRSARTRRRSRAPRGRARAPTRPRAGFPTGATAPSNPGAPATARPRPRAARASTWVRSAA